jgi:hypothetical protein
MQGLEFMRVATGAGSHTRDMPARITDYVPSETDLGGWWDNTVRITLAILLCRMSGFQDESGWQQST